MLKKEKIMKFRLIEAKKMYSFQAWTSEDRAWSLSVHARQPLSRRRARSLLRAARGRKNVCLYQSTKHAVVNK